MMYVVPPKIKDKTAAKWAKALAPVLAEGEEVWAFAKVVRLVPQTEALAVTNRRLLGFKSYAMTADKIVVLSAEANKIIGFGFAEKLGSLRLIVNTAAKEVSFGDVRKDEIEFIRHYVQYLVDAGRGSTSVEETTVLHAATAPIADESRQRSSVQRSPAVVGVPLDDSWARAIENTSGPDEFPALIISSGSAGSLAAFEDRVVIVKARIMDGRVFESRTVAFAYADISEFEYRRGLSDGVLEVRTQNSATAALDTVRGWDGSAPNTLRLPWALHEQAVPYLDDLRRKVAAAQRRKPVSLWKPPLEPRIVDRPPAEVAPADGLAVEIEKLANLFSQGLIDAEEFREAKRAVIAAHS